MQRMVTTLVVVWIEILKMQGKTQNDIVTTLVVVWIEIPLIDGMSKEKPSHHSRSGVD